MTWWRSIKTAIDDVGMARAGLTPFSLPLTTQAVDAADPDRGERCCNLCAFWAQDHSGWGECRRQDPVMGTGQRGKWPRTHNADWCGEHRFRVDLDFPS